MFSFLAGRHILRRFQSTCDLPASLKRHTCFLVAMLATTTIASLIWATTTHISTLTPSPVTHPFLIVKQGEYEELRQLSLRSPWREMKSSAINDASGLAYDSADDYIKKSYRLSQIVSTNALSYILDAANQSIYKTNMLKAFDYWDDLYPGLYQGGADDWTHAVPPATAIFNCILALDIIHDSLTPVELSVAESKLSRVAQWYWTHDEPHMSIWGVRVLWSLYKGEARFATALDKYHSLLMEYITPDGVFPAGPGYAAARFGQSNSADPMQHLVDVLEFTGNGAYYSDPVVVRFQEWLFGYSITPFKRNFVFGDSAPVKSTLRYSSASYRSYRFSDRAARYAAWDIQGEKPKDLLLAYVLMRKPLPAPEKAKSRIFTNGGAWFLEDNSSPNSLAGVLWNAKIVGDNHAHKEVNSLNLCGYGEYLLRNSGYTGWRQGASGFSWDYINSRAVSGNTVLINYAFTDDFNPPLSNDHVSKAGAGISEGFVTPSFDYASGDSGSALSNGKHFRNLVFVHPQDAKGGYWVIFDEVNAIKEGDTIHVALHPNSALYSTITANQEYQWTINKYSGHDVFLTIFLGTPPRNSESKNGVLAANWGDTSFVGKYLYSSYESDSTGKRNIVTVLFPHDTTHAKASMTRVVGDGYTGATVSLGEAVMDVALESSASGTVTYNGISFQGLATLYRLQHRTVGFYFLRKGRSFDYGMTTRNGFAADANISIYVKGAGGKITSPGTDVTFYYSGITGVLLNGQAAPLLSKGAGWVKTAVAAGTYDLKFVTTAS